MSDWVAGTKARTVVINITTDEAEQINHVGIGYHLVLPSGLMARESGWTWHGEADVHDGDPKMVATLQAIVDRIRADLAEHEGLSPSGDDSPGALGSDGEPKVVGIARDAAADRRGPRARRQAGPGPKEAL